MIARRQKSGYSFRSKIHRVLFFGGIGLFVLSYLFFPKLNSLSVVILILNWIIEGSFKQKFSNIKHNKFIGLFTSLYLIFAVGILYSSQLNEALSHAKTKLGILLLPIIFGTTDLSKKHFNLFIKLFVAAVSFALAICYFHLIFTYLTTDAERLVTHNFHAVLNIHRTYFGLSIAFAICIVIYFLISEKSSAKAKRNNLIFLLVFLLFSLLIVGSRMPTLSLAFLFLILFIRFIRHSSAKLRWFAGAMIIALVAFSLLLFKYSTSFDKFKKISSDSRSEIWTVAGRLMPESLPFGYGTGDVKKIRNNYYFDNGMNDLLKGNMNFHNQYFETILQVGIPGILILLANLFTPLYLAIKQKNFLYFSFIVLIIFGFLTESMLHTQKGVLFYAFFNSFVFFYHIQRNNN